MTVLTWDVLSERRFEAGLDRGVLYLADGTGIAWNGLSSVEEDKSDNKVTPYYFDGVKYTETRDIGDFAGTIKAFTYPDEFLVFDGTIEAVPGYSLTSQPVRSRFGLSYRTKSGNALDGADAYYKIHLMYNLLAEPDNISYSSYQDVIELSEFGWTITGVPIEIPGFRPTVHVIFDTRFLSPELLADVEEILYGTEETDPILPSFDDLHDGMMEWLPFSIVDNGDGTWTATGSSFNILNVSDDEFQITADQANPIDDDTYGLTTT